MQREIIVQFENIPGGQPQARAAAAVIIVREWNDRVQAIIATSHLQYDENG